MFWQRMETILSPLERSNTEIIPGGVDGDCFQSDGLDRHKLQTAWRSPPPRLQQGRARVAGGNHRPGQGSLQWPPPHCCSPWGIGSCLEVFLVTQGINGYMAKQCFGLMGKVSHSATSGWASHSSVESKSPPWQVMGR